MIIAAHAIGAARGIVYLRAEYVYLREYLEQQLAELREEGLLGDRIRPSVSRWGPAHTSAVTNPLSSSPARASGVRRG